MPLRTKLQIAITLLATAGATVLAASLGSSGWLPFWLLLLGVLLGSGLKVGLPRGGDGTMSLDFPFILLGIVLLSPLQAMLLAALSVAAQSRLRVDRLFTIIQIGFNVANAMLSTACALVVFYALQHLAITTAPALALSAVAYFLCNTVALAFILGSFKEEHPLVLWRTEFSWYFPFYLVGAALAAAVHWMSHRFGWGTALLLIPVVYTLYRAYVGQVTQIQERQQHLEETEALQLRTIEGLAMAIEAKDQNTHDHLFRVRHYVRALGKELHLSAAEMQALETAAFLHDIGKLAVPESIINKPGRLTPEEFEKMKIHPVVGADILERVRFPYPVVPVVRSHHEWWNGTGYPDGLQGDAIPLGARILTVVDCFDALVSDRPYRKGLTSTKALEIIRGLSGKQFDPSIVRLFEKCHADAEAELEKVAPIEFTPLNTSVDVSRGPAPGAGFEAESEGVAGQVEPAVSLTVTTQTPPSATLSLQADGCDETPLTFGAHLLHSDLKLATTALVADLRQKVPFEACAAYLVKSDQLEMVFSQARGSDTFPGRTLQLGSGISGWVAENRKPIFNGNAGVEQGCPSLADGSAALNAALSIPLIKDESAIGVFTLYASQTDAFRRDQLSTVLLAGVSLSSLLENLNAKQSEPVVKVYKPEPPLKSLEDFFAVFEKEITKAVCSRQHCIVATCVLDGLEATAPSVDGDEVLAGLLSALSWSLQQNGLQSEILAPLGPRKLLILRPASNDRRTSEWSQAVQRCLKTACEALPGRPYLAATVQVAVCPEDGLSIEDLLSATSDKTFYPLHTGSNQHLLQTSHLAPLR